MLAFIGIQVKSGHRQRITSKQLRSDIRIWLNRLEKYLSQRRSRVRRSRQHGHSATDLSDQLTRESESRPLDQPPGVREKHRTVRDSQANVRDRVVHDRGPLAVWMRLSAHLCSAIPIEWAVPRSPMKLSSVGVAPFHPCRVRTTLPIDLSRSNDQSARPFARISHRARA